LGHISPNIKNDAQAMIAFLKAQEKYGNYNLG
jgi:hypothetical protein